MAQRLMNTQQIQAAVLVRFRVFCFFIVLHGNRSRLYSNTHIISFYYIMIVFHERLMNLLLYHSCA